jgi:hypothetical protein
MPLAPRPTLRPRRAALALALTLAASVAGSALVGCGSSSRQVSDVCPPPDSTGGGSPVGTWTVTDSCQIPYARTATPDWCSQLVYFATMGKMVGTVKDGLFLGQEFIPIATDKGQSTVTYMDNMACANHDCGTYSAMLVFAGPTTTNFPLGCLKAHTPNPTCDDLTTQINALAMNVLPLIENLHCVPAADESCDCSYTVSTDTIAPDVGNWRIENNLLVHYPTLPSLFPPELADFQVSGDMMQLHGHNGVPLLAHDPLRSLTLQRKP